VNYRLSYTDEARRALRSLPGRYRQRARRIIESLAHEPTPPPAEELRDLPHRYRIPLNGWRIIYRVDAADGALIILAVRLKTGPETYANLPE
jgi:mRNA-degrading endonuclease RelE of RelBE toxin-antitoxin system